MTPLLVPLDGSNLAETVLPYVKQLAKAMPRGEVGLLHVVEQGEGRTATDPAGIPAPSKRATADPEEYLKKVLAYFHDSGVFVTSKVRSGVPAAEIIAEAESRPGTVTAMSTHGRSGITRWMIGSVADKVVHWSTGPVLLVRPTARSPIAPEPGFRAVVVPLDGSPVAELVLPHVVEMARAMSLRTVLVRATPTLFDYYKWTSDVTGYVPDYTDVAEEVDAEATENLKAVATRLRHEGLSEVETHLLHGDAAAAINDTATSLGLDGCLVAMTTRGRTGLVRTVLGSVADRVVRHGGCPVFLVRPAPD